MKLAESRYGDGRLHGYIFRCPGCHHAHVYDERWQFNGNLDRPTFTPSLLNTSENHPDPKQRRCHLHMTDGKIAFCTDCSHDLAGQTVDVPDWNAGDV